MQANWNKFLDNMNNWYWWHPVEWFCLSWPDLDVRYFSWLCAFVAYLYYNKTLLTETQPNFSSLFHAFMYSSALCLPNYKTAEQQSHNFLFYCHLVVFIILKTILKGGQLNSFELVLNSMIKKLHVFHFLLKNRRYFSPQSQRLYLLSWITTAAPQYTYALKKADKP